jgi:hypothetical protein
MCTFLLARKRSLVWPSLEAVLLLLIAGGASPGYSAPSMSALTREYSNYTPSDPDCKNLKDTTSVAYHSATGKVYISTDLGCIAEIDANTLDAIRSKDLNQGVAHQLASDGEFIYVHTIFNRPNKKHKVLKIDPSATTGLSVIRQVTIGNATGSPEGFVFLGSSLYVGVGGYDGHPGRLPGKIVKLSKSNLAIQATWTIPTGANGPNNENHGLTTDGTNLYVLTVPQRNKKKDRYYKLNQSLALLASHQFSTNGALGGNVYLGGKIYTSGGKLWKLDPSTLAEEASQGCGVHWLASDSTYIYRLGGKFTGSSCTTRSDGNIGYIEVVDPNTMSVLLSYRSNPAWVFLHYGIVANGFLWVAYEGQGSTVPSGRIARYKFSP